MSVVAHIGLSSAAGPGRLSLHPVGESLPTGWTQATEDQQLLSYRPIHI
jgi:hypothetical protein